MVSISLDELGVCESISELFDNIWTIYDEEDEIEIETTLENYEYVINNNSLVFGYRTRLEGKLQELILDEDYAYLPGVRGGVDVVYYRSDNNYNYGLYTLRFDNVDFEMQVWTGDPSILGFRIRKRKGLRKMLITKEKLVLQNERFKHSDEWKEFVVPLIKSLGDK